MRFSLEVWILVAILWTQVLVSVGVYVREDPVTLEDRSGQNGGSNRRDNSQTTENPTGSRSNSNRRSSSETMENIEGPLIDVISPGRLPDVHCVELRSKRYISDGFCTSTRPIMEVLCTGSCIPEPSREWYHDHYKARSNNKNKDYRCVNDHVRQKRVTLICDNGQTRTYRIKTVRSCKCKRLQNQHNQSQRTSPSNVSARLVPQRNRGNRNNKQ